MAIVDLNSDADIYRIGIVRNADYILPVVREDGAGNPVDWDAEVFAMVDAVRGGTPVRVDAVVSGSLAEIRFESTLLDTLRQVTTWRVLMSVGSTPTSYESPVMVGYFERVQDRPGE